MVSGLGAPTYDVAAAGDRALNFYLWGAMGGTAMVGLGLALAQQHRRVLVLTGDGDMLMGLGSLARSPRLGRRTWRSPCWTMPATARPAPSAATPRSTAGSGGDRRRLRLDRHRNRPQHRRRRGAPRPPAPRASVRRAAHRPGGAGTASAAEGRSPPDRSFPAGARGYQPVIGPQSSDPCFSVSRGYRPPKSANSR